MKKVYKVIAIILIIISMYTILYNVSAKEIWNDAQGFLDRGNKKHDKTSLSEWIRKDLIGMPGAKTKIESVLGFLWGLGLLVIFISTVVLGIKYMLVSPNEKSRLKQATTPYIIGVVVIFGAVTIWNFIITVLEG